MGSAHVPFPMGLKGGALEVDAEPQRAGGRGSQSVPTQGNDLGSPRCCTAEEGSKIILRHKLNRWKNCYICIDMDLNPVNV